MQANAYTKDKNQVSRASDGGTGSQRGPGKISGVMEVVYCGGD